MLVVGLLKGARGGSSGTAEKGVQHVNTLLVIYGERLLRLTTGAIVPNRCAYGGRSISEACRNPVINS